MRIASETRASSVTSFASGLVASMVHRLVLSVRTPTAAQNAADASSRMQGGSSAVGSKPAPPVESSVPAARAVIGCEGLLDKVNRALRFRLATCVGSCGDPAGGCSSLYLLQRQQEFETPDSRAGPCFPPECPQPSHLYAFDKHHHAADIDPRTRHSRRVRAAER